MHVEALSPKSKPMDQWDVMTDGACEAGSDEAIRADDMRACFARDAKDWRNVVQEGKVAAYFDMPLNGRLAFHQRHAHTFI